jgi:hypothetical protein
MYNAPDSDTAVKYMINMSEHACILVTDRKSIIVCDERMTEP